MFRHKEPFIFVGASASTMLPSAEFIYLCVAIARSFGRNYVLAAPGASRTQYEFIGDGGFCYARVNLCRINRGV